MDTLYEAILASTRAEFSLKTEVIKLFLVILKHCDTFQMFEFLRQKWAKWTFENPKIYFFLKMNAAML